MRTKAGEHRGPSSCKERIPHIRQMFTTNIKAVLYALIAELHVYVIVTPCDLKSHGFIRACGVARVGTLASSDPSHAHGLIHLCLWKPYNVTVVSHDCDVFPCLFQWTSVSLTHQVDRAWTISDEQAFWKTNPYYMPFCQGKTCFWWTQFVVKRSVFGITTWLRCPY
jgi:hypothetical protein